MHHGALPLRFPPSLVFALVAQVAGAQEAWHTQFHLSDLDESVLGLTSFADAAGERLVAVGVFQSAGPEIVGHVASWDGSRWSALGAGLGPSYGAGFCATEYDDGGGPALYVGGQFSSAGDVATSNVARWDGVAWSALGAGTGGVVFALTGHDEGGGPALYAGGDFDTAGGAAVANVARWDSGGWSALGSGVDGEVRALASFDDGSGPALYAGGDFSHAGGVLAPGIARWDGQAWSALAPGPPCSIQALAVHDDGTGPALYAAGTFAASVGPPRHGIARWKGGAWTFAGELPFAAYPHALTSHAGGPGAGPALFVGGSNWDSGGVWKARSGVLRYFAGTLPLDPSNLYALASVDFGSGPRLVAGGWFSGMQPAGPASTVPAMNVAAWDGAAWDRLGAGGQGLDSYAWRLETLSAPGGASDRVVALGEFSLAGDHPQPGAALWDGHAWSELADGRSHIHELIEDPRATGSGAFYAALGGRVAHWDGAAWSRLDGLAGSIEAFAFVEGAVEPDLVAAGDFLVDGAPQGQALARWDGVAWRVLGLRGTASAVATWVPAAGAPAKLAVAGNFQDPLSGVGVAHIEDGVWSWLGGAPVEGLPIALAALPSGDTSQLHLGGAFTAVAGVPARSIARWDGASWSPLQGGVTGTVYDLAVRGVGSGAELIVGGAFEHAGGVRVGNIARWDGVAWSPLGSEPNLGTNGWVRALAVAGSSVFAGGAFTQAGGHPSSFVGCWGPQDL